MLPAFDVGNDGVCGVGAYSKLESCDHKLRVLSVLQTYIILAFVFAVLGTSSSFGYTPKCNGHAVMVISGRLNLLGKGWIAVLAIIIMITAYYTLVTYLGYQDTVVNNFYRKQRKKIENKYPGKPIGVNIPDPPPSTEETEDFPHAENIAGILWALNATGLERTAHSNNKNALDRARFRSLLGNFSLNTEPLII